VTQPAPSPSPNPDSSNSNGNNTTTTATTTSFPQFHFLLGLIPQRTWYTVFKGIPNNNESTPAQTAIREFEEETGTQGQGLLSIDTFVPETTLHGKVGNKKKLEIFLYEGSWFLPTQHFCLERVVPIDTGYMKGRPEIVSVRWMTLDEALSGITADNNTSTKGTTTTKARIYKSQESILQDAHTYLVQKYGGHATTNTTSTTSSDFQKKQKKEFT
jgi:8-oxo-dGTP pyrophosphatase MutT (NUDIX family)